ncbi:hypothetical protein ACWD4O_10110 [Streptomyces sp. NPDC002623]
MPTSQRAADLRAALQDALGGQVDLVPLQRGTRISAAAPDAADWERWRKAIEILRTADAWGSSSASGTPEIWARVDNHEVSP